MVGAQNIERAVQKAYRITVSSDCSSQASQEVGISLARSMIIVDSSINNDHVYEYELHVSDTYRGTIEEEFHSNSIQIPLVDCYKEWLLQE
jgi:hypothetical protein